MSNESKSSEVYHSAGFTVYPQLGKIEVGENTLTFGPVNMKVLLILLQNQGEAVSRAAIYEQVWGKQIVSDDALTRCISDLRIQLGKHTEQEALIETLPKRGYRWLAEVQTDNQIISHKVIEKTNALPSELKDFSLKQYAIWTVSSVVFLFVAFTATFWFLSKPQQSSTIQIVLLPVQMNSEEQQTAAIFLEELLQEHLLATDHLRFLSSGAISNGLQNPYPYLAIELDAQWVIEGQIRGQQNDMRLSLSLVDAKTGLVIYTRRKDFDGDEFSMKNIASEFVTEISSLLAN